MNGLSAHASAEIHVMESAWPYRDFHQIRPGSTAGHLAAYRDFLRRPGRLELSASECSACPGCQYMDIAVVRDALEATAELLPSVARVELRRLLRRLDAEFRRRTLPDPDPDRWRGWDGQLLPWWHRRVYASSAGRP